MLGFNEVIDTICSSNNEVINTIRSSGNEVIDTIRVTSNEVIAAFHISQICDERKASFVGNGLHVQIYPDKDYPFTRFTIANDKGAMFDEHLYCSHLALGKLLTEYKFENILEIGSRNGCAARAFAFAGKNITTVEIAEGFEAQYNMDYLDAKFEQPFDAIWCSHVLEHQRHIGKFCEKLFSDLKEGGVLAITVPENPTTLMLGHCITFTSLHLIYHLILAGFDCSEACVRQYDYNISCIVTKKSNGIPPLTYAAHPNDIPDLPRFFPSAISNAFTSGWHADGRAMSKAKYNWE